MKASSMMQRLTTYYAKNYSNWTLIVHVLVGHVGTFLFSETQCSSESTVTGLQYIFAADSMGLSSFRFFVFWSKRHKFCTAECIIIQGHSRSLILAPIESMYVTSYWYSVATLVISWLVSEKLQLLHTESHFFPYLTFILAKILEFFPLE